MKKRILSLFLCFIMIIPIFTGCSNDKDKSSKDKIKIIATNYVLADFAKEIGKEKVDVEVLIDSGENSKTHELSNKDINKINEADIFLYNGLEAEPWVANALEQIDNKDVLIVDGKAGINVKTDNYNINQADNEDYKLLSKRENNTVNKEESSSNEKLEDKQNNKNDSNNNTNNTNTENNNQNNTNNNSNTNTNNNTNNNTNSDSNNHNNNTNNNTNNSNNDNNTNNNANNNNQNTNNNTSNNQNKNEQTSDNSSENIQSSTKKPSNKILLGKREYKTTGSDFSSSATTKSGYTLATLPSGQNIEEGELFDAINNYISKYPSGTSVGLYNGSNITLVLYDTFWGNKCVSKIEKYSDLPANANVYYEPEAIEYIKKLHPNTYNFSSIKVDKELSQDNSNEKVIMIDLNYMFSDSNYYCLYNSSKNKPELFNVYHYIDKLNMKFVKTIDNKEDIMDYLFENNVICDEKSYAFFSGLNLNATTEKEQYHNYWMNINNAKIMVKNIYDKLYLKDEKNAEYYTQNYTNYIELLDSLDSRFKKMVENSEDKFVILTGEFNCFYLLNYLGLDYMSVYDYEYQTTQPSIVRQANIVKFIKNNKDSVEYVLTEGDDTITKSICEEAGVASLEINSMINIERKNQNKEEFSYINIMESNYTILKTILN